MNKLMVAVLFNDHHGGPTFAANAVVEVQFPGLPGTEEQWKELTEAVRQTDIVGAPMHSSGMAIVNIWPLVA